MACGIYKITNTVNDKSYIGQSIDILSRWRRHRTTNTRQSILTLAIKKYGIENFIFEILEECPKSELNKKEIYWIKYYDTYKNGYNQTIGGNQSHAPQKLSEKDLLAIVNLLQSTDMLQKDIAIQFNVSKETIYLINTGRSRLLENIQYPIRKKNLQDRKHKRIFCIECNKELTKKRATGMCKECLLKTKVRPDKPSREELKELIRIIPFTTIGKNFQVSDTAIKKWCTSYNLPKTKKDIKKISDEEWNSI